MAYTVSEEWAPSVLSLTVLSQSFVLTIVYADVVI